MVHRGGQFAPYIVCLLFCRSTSTYQVDHQDLCKTFLDLYGHVGHFENFKFANGTLTPYTAIY